MIQTPQFKITMEKKGKKKKEEEEFDVMQFYNYTLEYILKKINI